MSDYSYLHEAEDVWLISETLRWVSELKVLLPELGFGDHEDLFTVDRKGTIPLWQSRSVVSLYVLRGDAEVFDEHSHWDRLKLRYLMATLPADTLPEFVDKVSAVAERLRVQMRFRGLVVTKDELRSKLDLCLLELREQVGEPGTSEVAAVVESTYPRRS